jgi:hypothetical protein
LLTSEKQHFGLAHIFKVLVRFKQYQIRTTQSTRFTFLPTLSVTNTILF